MAPNRDKGSAAGRKVIASNRRARHDYAIEDSIECGIVLENYALVGTSKAALETLKKYNAAVRMDIPFNPNVKDGRGTTGLAVPKSNCGLFGSKELGKLPKNVVEFWPESCDFDSV